MLKSSTATLAPGRSTRSSSRSALGTSATLRNPYPIVAAAKRAGKRVKYEPEGRADAAAERQAGVDKLRASNKSGRKRAKKGGAVEE